MVTNDRVRALLIQLLRSSRTAEARPRTPSLPEVRVERENSCQSSDRNRDEENKMKKHAIANKVDGKPYGAKN